MKSSKPPRRRNFAPHLGAKNDDDWTLKPLDDPHPLQLCRQFSNDDEQYPEDPSSPSAASTSSHQSKQVSITEFSSPKSSNRRNRRRGWRCPSTLATIPKSPKSPTGSSGCGEREGPEMKEDEKDHPLVEENNGAVGDGGENVSTGKRTNGSSKLANKVGDVMSRLAELQLSAKEAELSEEQIKINDQAQEDELLAVKAIYGDNVHDFDKFKGLRSFQIHIYVETAGEVAVSAIFKSDSDSKSKDKTSAEAFSYSFNVEYLPPIVLSLLLPKSYPSHSPPSFSISVKWLDSDRISSLCSMLDNLWLNQPGQEILYLWVDCLHSSSLNHLGFDKGITLRPYGMTHDVDWRAISGSVSPDVDIPFLKCFNEEKRHEKFLYDVHECCICFSEYAGTEFLRLPCQHFFCSKCMKTYADMHIREGTINKLVCPDDKCDGMVPPGLLKRLLGEEEYERWESSLLQKTLDSMSDVAYCPRCETPCIEDEDQHAQCSKCFFSFCTLCRDRRHVGIDCMTPEMRLRILEERQNSSQLKDDQKRKEREMINDLLSVKEILRDAKQCPSCKMAISRTEGCNKMVCENCGQYFCYRCNKAIAGYDHFWDGGCELFPQEEIQVWEQRTNARQVLAQIHVQLFAEHGGRPCPVCRQVNVKMGGNNHIFCWSCQSHYCYLCREIVRRSSQHYGPKGCKQHSAD